MGLLLVYTRDQGTMVHGVIFSSLVTSLAYRPKDDVSDTRQFVQPWSQKSNIPHLYWTRQT